MTGPKEHRVVAQPAACEYGFEPPLEQPRKADVVRGIGRLLFPHSGGWKAEGDGFVFHAGGEIKDKVIALLEENGVDASILTSS